MASESPQIETTPPRTDLGDQATSPVADSAKRKAEQGNGTQTRAKRNRYISIAWYVIVRLPPIYSAYTGRHSILPLTEGGLAAASCHPMLYPALLASEVEIFFLVWANESFV